MPSRGHVDTDAIDLYEVKTPSGRTLRLLTEEEAEFYNDHRDKYIKEYRLENASDLQTVEVILTMEVMISRWSMWLTQGFDYDEGVCNAEELRRNIQQYSLEVRNNKISLGIDRVARQKDKGEDIASYLENLRQRAGAFGIKRSSEAARAIELFKEAENRFGLILRTDKDEQEYLKIDALSVYKWFMDEAVPEMNKIDGEFIKTGQRFWIKEI